MRKPKPKLLPAIRPNAGIEARFQRDLDREIAAMQADIVRTIKATYRANPPKMATDASPAADLMSSIRKLRGRWLSRFDKLAPELARYFATAAADRVDASLRASLRKAGFTVQFKLTPEQNDIVQATVHESVGLIKSIVANHLTQVEGLVMRSVQEGRKLSIVAKGLEHELGVTKRKAAMIALNQNNQATAAIHRNRQMELGVRAVWMHSAGGKTKRRSHVANSGKEYDPATGWFDPDAKVWCWPGTLINCRCVSRAVIPGFD